MALFKEKNKMVRMAYTSKDLIQATIGAFMAILVFLAIRGDNPFFFNSTSGIVISIFVVWIYWKGFNIRDDLIHFVINLSVAFIISAIISYLFGLITYEQIFSREVFGSLVIVAWWIAIPLALVFDQYNFTNPLKRFYIRGK
ncbi:hypothetical protein LCGC14_1335590 [marine sediment metagenome]|uniref:Uncharacterized protein n=1 Tax=marine sediment metagenome TaxID=412755 RepID=A0A0F9KF79_9ZZZZ